MTFLYPLGLLGLIGIPILIIIYIIKNKFQEKKIGSIYLWQLSQKFMKKRKPFTQINGLLSLILQLLAITVMSLAIAHPIFAIPGSAENYVFVLDGSASMGITKDGISRFDYAKGEIETIIENNLDGSKYTLIFAGEGTQTVIEKEKTKSKVTKALEKLTVTALPTTIDDAISNAQNLFDDDKSLNIIVYTDKTYLKTSENFTLVNCYREETNHSLLSFSDKETSDGTTFTAEVYAYGKEETLKADLYLDDKLIEEKEVTTNSEKSTTVSFTSTKSYSKAECKILGDDALTSDDDTIIYKESDKEQTDVLLVSESPFYLYSALNSMEDVTVDYKSQEDYTGDEIGYDVYIFDAIVPISYPSDGSVWLIGENENITDCGFTIQGEVNLTEAGYLTYDQGNDNAYRKITNNTNNSSIAVGSYYQYSYISDFTTILSLDTYPMLSVRTMNNNYKEVVFSFDLHKSNMPLLYDYPILIKNLLSYCSPTPLESRLYTCGDTLNVERMPNCNSNRLTYPSGKILYLDDTQASPTALLDEVGSYTLTVFYDNDSVDYSFYVHFPYSESQPYIEAESLTLEGQKEENALNGELDKMIIVIAVVLLIMILDWGVYLHEQHQLC